VHASSNIWVQIVLHVAASWLCCNPAGQPSIGGYTQALNTEQVLAGAYWLMSDRQPCPWLLKGVCWQQLSAAMLVD
jgi:hypothetical protein